MFFDWLGREGGALLAYWLLTLLAAAAVYPIFYRLMGSLPGRGYALARAAGVLLIGYVYWMLNNLGLLNNSPGATVAAGLIVVGIGAVSYFTWAEREPLLPWLRRHLGLILTTEALFIVLFLGWATVRALNPSLVATEKPMEMAFLSAVRRSAQFPPHDPWLSGYAISYYHFGYILMGTLANMAGVTNGVAFNISIALLFALTGVGAFGVAYEMVALRLRSQPTDLPSPTGGEELGVRGTNRPALIAGLLACIFAVIMGNLGTALVEIPYQTRNASAQYLSFMNLEERDSVLTGCPPSGSADPTTWCYWWWFRYSRVVRDMDISGQPLVIQPITEFPQFSFVLADMHPHVLALPWAMLAIGLALNLVVRRRRLEFWELLLYGVFIGGMVFLNSWDAVYLGLIVGAEALRRLITDRLGWFAMRNLLGIGGFALAMLALTGVLYLPFFLGFRSQAGGIVPNLLWPTQFQQFFLMFGPFLVILGAYLWVERRRAGPAFNAPFAVQAVLFIILALVVALVILGAVAWSRADVRYAVYQAFDESGGLAALLPGILRRRLDGLLTEGLLLAGLFLIVARLFARTPERAKATPNEESSEAAHPTQPYAPVTGFALLLIAAGAVLALAPDFVYLRDGFGVRINTIFKLWYQAWLMWSVASAYALWSLFAEVTARLKAKRTVGPDGELVELLEYAEPVPAGQMRSAGRVVFGVVAAGLIVLGLIYPLAAILSRAMKEGGHLDNFAPTMTLEGGPSLAAGAEDYTVIQCLASVAKLDSDVVAEATKDSIAYNITGIYGRVAGLTGIPTLVGWDNHERQWRGDTFGAANTLTYMVNGQQMTETRQQAIATLYNTTDLNAALGVIDRYGITYIFVGLQERRDFAPEGLAKFAGLQPVCVSGDTAAYSADSFRGLVNSTAGTVLTGGN